LWVAPAQANYWEGFAAFKRGDYRTAHQEFDRLAELGHAAAQFNLGYLHHHGLAVPRNPAAAARWYRAAAEHGRVEAQFSMGTLYETGSGVPHDLAEAYRWYNLAASNVPPGKSRDRLIKHRERVSFQLGDRLRDAVETTPAPSGFTLGADLAAAAEVPALEAPPVLDVQRELAARKFNPGPLDGQMGRSTVGALSAFQASTGLAVTGELDAPTLDKLFGPEEVAPHLEPFPRAALVLKEPSPPAVPVPPVEQVELAPEETPAQVAEAQVGEAPAAVPEAVTAASVATGPEIEPPEPDPQGLDALRRLAKQGDATAQINLATMYHYGQGVAEDHEEAAKWYRLAAGQGRADAMFPLGSLYEFGARGQQDLVEAHKWYSLAAEKVASGKAHEIIVKRRDRVAQQLSPELLASAEGTTAPSAGEPEPAHRDEPAEATPANRAPSGLVFTLLSGAAPARASVAENVKDGTVIGSVGATDPDSDEALTYELVDDAGGRFDIDSRTGKFVVVDGARLDFEETASYDIVVRVTDSGGLSHEEALPVTVTDINEAPAAAAATFTVAENAAGGTALGRINALDLDGGANGTLTYAFSEDGPFAIDPDTGEVTVAEGADLDFETQPRFELAAIVTDGGGLSAGAAVTVKLKDENEAPHGIVMAAGGTVSEGVPADTVVGRIGASDPDGEDRLTYSLAEDSGGRFAIDKTTGTLMVAAGTKLDFEQSNSHPVTVRVTDSGGLSHEGTVAIAVSDVNETPRAEAETFRVAENAPDGTAIGRISAEDPDGGANGRLRYAITEGDAAGYVAIDPKTGELSVAHGAGLDFEADAALELTVTVSDGNGLSDAALVTVVIRDGNEPPEDLTVTGGMVAENAKSGTLVATLLASDPDAGERLRYSLTEDAGGRFVIDAETGAISVAEGSVFDHDEAASHEIGVKVTDAGGLSYSERLTVAVTDETLAPTGIALTDGTVAENAEAGTLVARISASDPDAPDASGRVTYRLTEDSGGRFVIDPETGAISVAEGASFDFEAEPSHQLLVQVTDSGGLSHEEAMAIVVTDANEAPSAQAASFELDETAGPGTTVGRLSARDPDSGTNGALRYAITGDNSNGRFAVDPATGTISVAEGAKLDFEERRSFKLEVTAIDGGGLSDSALAAIDLVDRNEAPNGVRLISSKVPENAAGGTFAGQVAALDPDAGDIATYRLIEDADGRFVIDFGTGVVTVAKGATLDFEATERHRLVVRVTDSGSLTYDEAFSIALSDVNEPPTARAASLTVAENASSGALVGRLSAADPDAGDRLAYGLRDNAGGRFAIDADTGTVMVADGAGLDFEQSARFEITASVSDSGGLSTSVELIVEIANLNEEPSGQVMIEGTVTETAAHGTLAAAYRATDPDPGDRVTYSLGRNAGGRFAIDPATGLITVARGAKFDVEQAAEHDVTVWVTDKAGLTHHETLTIAVLEVDETPPAKPDLLAQHLAAPIGGPEIVSSLETDSAKIGGPDGRAAIDSHTNGNATSGDTNGTGTNGTGPYEKADRGQLLEAVVAADNKLKAIGSNGLGAVDRVAALQAQLVEAGFNPGPVDGKMGPMTRAAMGEYQKVFKLTELKDEDLLDHLLVRTHFQRGYSFHAQGDLDKSIAEYSEVVRLDPDYYIAYYNRGLIHYDEARYERAIEDFAKVIEVRPDYAGAFVNRGNAYYRQGLYALAADDYLTAVGHWVWPW
jgi:TPR repeat protein